MTAVWRALPVHPKTAVLFLWGVPAHEALFQAFAWYQWLPIGSQECLAPLLKFMLGATTEDAATAGAHQQSRDNRGSATGRTRSPFHGLGGQR
jgi:hypothetical protein